MADGNNRVDEYPNEQNNVRAAQLTITPVPFADLVTSNVVAPDQAVHGSSIEVRYTVSNKGSALTRGVSDNINQWTDSVWLAKDPRRPGANKGDILLSTTTHTGKLAVNEDYQGSLQVVIPEGIRSGQYFITVWSDSYDVILEDTLANQLNPDDPNQLDNNNYKARAISILGVTPPDLVVSALSGTAQAQTDDVYSFSYTVTNQGDELTGTWQDRVYLADSPDWESVTQLWEIARIDQNRSLGLSESYTVEQSLTLPTAIQGRYLLVRTDAINDIAEANNHNNFKAISSQVSTIPADLQVTAVTTQPTNYSGEATTVSWTVTNHGGAVWAGTEGWVDSIYISKDPVFIADRAIAVGAVIHYNTQGLASQASYTASATINLPVGAEGTYYVYVISDSQHDSTHLSSQYGDKAMRESLGTQAKEIAESSQSVQSFYRYSVFEGINNSNNIGQGRLQAIYREPDLHIDHVSVSKPNPQSGELVTVTWTVTNRGTRDTRSTLWFDGVYLSRDSALDVSDYPFFSRLGDLSPTVIRDAAGNTTFLKPNESYTRSAVVRIPDAIEGAFNLIVQADTVYAEPLRPEHQSTIRQGLAVIEGSGHGWVQEFQGEANNGKAIAIEVQLTSPPDLQVSTVTIPTHVRAGQPFTVDYTVTNAGGQTPSSQGAWTDLVYLSRDRFLDVKQDRYLGYSQHTGGLVANGSYSQQLSFTAPRDLEGTWYVFVLTDPSLANQQEARGMVFELDAENNNASTAAQPLVIEIPPPADLVVSQVNLPSQLAVGGSFTIDYTVTNASDNPAYGRWTDAVYLSRDGQWDIGDILLGKVEHIGDVAGQASYTGQLTANVPPLKEGTWRVIVRPDLYNEVFEGQIRYTETGLNLPPAEANNRTASANVLQVTVPTLTVASPLATTLKAGEEKLYKVSVAAGETLRVLLDSSANNGANEVYVRYGEVPTLYAYDAAYDNPVAVDQQVLIPSTKAGDYYVLVRSREDKAVANPPAIPVSLRADLLPLTISQVTPDQGGVGDDNHRWVTLDIYGASFKAGALVKLTRAGVYDAEPSRWQVLDATHIRAIFDLRQFPLGLYDLTVINPDGQRVTEVGRYLVERGIEADVTIGVGGERSLVSGNSATYSVSLQSLTNVDTPYVRFDVGVPELGYNPYLFEGALKLPYLVFGTNTGGQPTGQASTDANNQQYGMTPTTPIRNDIAWAQLEGVQNTQGFNLAPAYAFDVQAGGFVGKSFTVQTFPGLNEWNNYDFEGLRDKLYATHPDWKAQGLLDGGVQDLNNIEQGLAQRFLSQDKAIHGLTEQEALSLSFQFNVTATAVALTRDQFIAEQQAHARQLRNAILADSQAPHALANLAADESQWLQGWLAALELAGLLRPVDQAPPIRHDALVLSLNTTLATGILLAKGGENYRTQADILAFFSQVQAWYGDTARYAGDPQAQTAAIDRYETRDPVFGGESVNSPVPALRDTANEGYSLNFNVFAGQRAELEYLRHLGLLDEKFRPVNAQALALTQYLAQGQSSQNNAVISVRGPQALPVADGQSYVPAQTNLPYRLQLNNVSTTPLGQIRLVTEIAQGFNAHSFRLGDIKLGDINIHLPEQRANFQGDFDFSTSKGFVLRISAGVDVNSRTATWLIQAINPDTGEVLVDATRGLLAQIANNNSAQQGFVSYTIQASESAISGTVLTQQTRVIFDQQPPVDSERVSVVLDADVPNTQLAVTHLGNNADGKPRLDVQWQATDLASGVKSVTVYVAENGGDFRIWLKQVPNAQSQALFVGEAGKSYEFLAVATDYAGNREAASISNAVLPDDGARQAILDSLGLNQSLSQTATTPLAANDRSYNSNALFQQATQQLAGKVANSQSSDLRNVLAPFSLRSFANGFSQSEADVGAVALVSLANGQVLISAGSQRQAVYRVDAQGGRAVTPLFELNSPIYDMTVDALGQLWVLTGQSLLQVDIDSGTVLRTVHGPQREPLTHALAIHPTTGEIYVASGNGIEIFKPTETDATKAWQHFSNQRVGDLSFASDGRLWAVAWSGSEITAATPNGTTDIVSLTLTGRQAGRAELEYRLTGVIDSIAFGQVGTALEGTLVASSQLQQRAVNSQTASTIPHQASVWMIELASKRILQVASGGTRGESIITTADGRILVAQSQSVDEIAPAKVPKVTAITVPEGSLVPLPLQEIGIVFDQDMAMGAEAYSVLNTNNYALIAVGQNNSEAIQPQAIRWDAQQKMAWLTVSGLVAGQYQLVIAPNIQSQTELALGQAYSSTFTTLNDLSHQLQLTFSNTRADRLTGQVSYDVSLKNIGTDDIKGPLTLLLNPDRYLSGISNAQQNSGEQSNLWLINLTERLSALGGKLAVGSSLDNVTVTLMPASALANHTGLAPLAKANLGHGIYAAPQDNILPTITLAADAQGAIQAWSTAQIGQTWTGQLQAKDADGSHFYWQLVYAPDGMTLHTETVQTLDDGYGQRATLQWAANSQALANTQVLVRVWDSRGSSRLESFTINVANGNHAPEMDAMATQQLVEGQLFSLPLLVSDADGDALSISITNLPSGAVFNAQTATLSWLPNYNQAGEYKNIVISVSDGKVTSQQTLNLIVAQAYPCPVFLPVANQTLREGETAAVQLQSKLPDGITLDANTQVTWQYVAPWLPGGTSLNTETGWLTWQAAFNQHGEYRVPVTAIATFSQQGQQPFTVSSQQEIVFNVLNANGTPEFLNSNTPWQVVEGQPLRINVMAIDPDNPDFEPRIRLSQNAPATGAETTPATVSYQVTGLPTGAVFDNDTLEIIWTPTYAQAGIYYVNVIATDDGDGTGTPAISSLTIPIVVNNANRAPDIINISNVILNKGSVVEIPVNISDVDGNPIQVSVNGLPRFATYTQNPSVNGQSTGIIRFSPSEGDRGDYTITVTAQDNGDGDINQVLINSKTFVVTVKSVSEAPVIYAPSQVAAVVGQPVSIAIDVRDADQDALTWHINGLPIDASLVTLNQYGQAVMTWTPTANDLGSHELDIAVTDSGLPPANAGYTPPNNPTPNTTHHNLRIIVREQNTAPVLLAVVAINALEGQALTVELFAQDADSDVITWQVTGLPTGMRLIKSNNNRLQLVWLPSYNAAQDSNANQAGLWQVQVTGSDGVNTFTRHLNIQVTNINQTPRILPMPLQLIQEGETLSFNAIGVDADNQAVKLSLLRDQDTPDGIYFDSASGYFEWTPDFNAVNNTHVQDKVLTFNFAVTDGISTSTQRVQVRVLDTNRQPELVVSPHALVVGQSFELPTQRGATSDVRALSINDIDGQAQTQALTINFSQLPQGTYFNSQTQRLVWTPNPAQIGDHQIKVIVSDGQSQTTELLTLRVFAEASANQPQISVITTPSTPVVPQQTVITTVRSQAWSPIAQITAQVRGQGLGLNDWQAITIDSAGRISLTPTQAGLIEIKVRATDIDGFSAEQQQIIRVKEPSDNQAPQVTWQGALLGVNDSNTVITLNQLTALEAQIQDQQLMGYQLAISPMAQEQWQLISSADNLAQSINGQLTIGQLDPADWLNGVYQLRLTVWDVAGKTKEINSRIVIDSSTKTAPQAQTTDAMYQLGSQTFALNRVFNQQNGDLANWQLDVFNSQLTTNQAKQSANGGLLAWQEGAKVWVTVPSSLTTANASLQSLSFSLNTQQIAINGIGAPKLWQAVFANEQGWQLKAFAYDDYQPESLTKLGDRLFDSVTGLPWQARFFEVTAPDGTRYHLNEQGQITSVHFSDGQQWLVSDSGIVAVGADSEQRVDFIRDSQGKISRVVGIKQGESQASTTLYSYNSQQQLIHVRTLGSTQAGSVYGYQANGSLIDIQLQANLGSATKWVDSAANPQWQGSLQENQNTDIGFSIRESELSSTVKVAGAQGAVLVAIQLTTDAQVTLLGGVILAESTFNGQRTLIARFTEAGLKVLRLQGTGTASIRLNILGDINQDGAVNGLDSQNQQSVDLNGDGIADALDGQLLLANYGWQANRAPVVDTLPTVKTHTDLQTSVKLASVAKDNEGDAIYWRVLSARNGQARLSSDGSSILFTPEQGFSGQATIIVQADDGYNLSAPITLTVNVSSAKLVAIHVNDFAHLRLGQQIKLQAILDFEDEKGVVLNQTDYLKIQEIDLGLTSAIQIHDDKDLISAKKIGVMLLEVGHLSSDGHTIHAYVTKHVVGRQVDEDGNTSYENPQSKIVLDVYPTTLALTTQMTRQLKVHLQDYQEGEYTDIHQATQLAFAGLAEEAFNFEDPETGEVFNETIPDIAPIYNKTIYKLGNNQLASVSDDGLITALANGQTILTVIHLVSHVDAFGNIEERIIAQSDFNLIITDATLVQEQKILLSPEGGVVETATGEKLLIGKGALSQETAVGIKKLDLSHLESQVGLTLPAQSTLRAVAAFELDLGNKATNAPVQLAIPVTDTSVQAGDEVFFFRRGTFIDGQGQMQETWWLVDNGFVGNDGIARTASPPFSGVSDTGIYAMMVKKGTQAGELIISLAKNTYAYFTADNFSIAGATNLIGQAINIALTGIISATAQVVNTIKYFMGVPQQASTSVNPNQNTEVSLGDNLPPVVTPNGVVKPVNISSVSYDVSSEKVILSISNNNAGTFVGTLAVRMKFIDGSYQDIINVAGDTNGTIAVSVPPYVALGTVNWQIVRLIPTTNVSPSGVITQGKPLEFTGNLANLSPSPDIMAVLTRTGVSFLRDNKEIGSTDLTYGEEGAYQFNGSIYGTKIQPIVLSTEGGRAYIAGGQNIIYVIDLITFKFYQTIQIPAGQNIASLAVAGQVLIIGEGRAYSTSGNYRLLALDINPTKNSHLNTPVTLQAPNLPSAPNGFAGMAVGNDGVTLVVAAPQKSTTWTNVGTASSKGDVLIFNLNTLNLKTGAIQLPVIAQLPNDGISLKGPRLVSATNDPNHYLVSSPNDYDRGLSTLVLTRNAQGLVVSGALTAIAMSQPNHKIKFDRLNILRADGAVLVERDGVEYALVADNNHPYNDPYFQAMFEVPSFAQLSPVGPPTAVGGSASAKLVNVGGKIGIIRDPFGKLAAPVYLGATIPFHGYGFTNLSLSNNSKVLIGQLRGDPTMFDGQAEKPHQTYVWNVDKLIQAALNQPDNERLIKPIKPQDVNGSNSSLGDQFLSFLGKAVDGGLTLLGLNNPAYGAESSTSNPISTTTKPSMSPLEVTGNMGDVIAIDLKELIKKNKVQLKSTLSDAEINNLTFNISTDVLNLMASNTGNFKLLTKAATGTTDARVLSYNSTSTGATEANFSQTGLMFVVPNLINDMSELHAAKKIGDKKDAMTLRVSYTLGTKTQEILIILNATDIKDANAFVGDRPLDNPGYSTFNLLSSSVSSNSTTNNRLDVARIEQRLKYLGFGDNLTFKNQIDVDVKKGEIKVDGVLDAAEWVSVRHFGLLVSNKTEYDDDAVKEKKNNQGVVTTPAKPATTIVVQNTTKTDDVFDWLNAYNAPHWVNIKAQIGVNLTEWDIESNTTITNYMGSSWALDLMKASENNNKNSKGDAREKLLFAGAGEIGNILELDIRDSYISKKNQDKVDGDEWLLGLSDINSVDLKDVVVPTGTNVILTPEQALKKLLQDKATLETQADGKWDYEAAKKLADLLKNVNRKPTTEKPDENSQGVNKQNEALKDFLAIYATTQKGAANGFWDGIVVKNGDTAKNALFGDGTQSGGVIDSNGVLLGGEGIGSKLTKETLAAIMDIKKTDAEPWVTPINEAMSKFDINTPKRLAIFLANVYKETGQLKWMWEAGWSPENTTQTLYDNQYGASGNKLGNTQTHDGSNFRGRGLLHITGRNNYNIAQDGGLVASLQFVRNTQGNYKPFTSRTVLGLNDIYPTAHYNFVTTPIDVSTDYTLASRIGAWFWRW